MSTKATPRPGNMARTIEHEERFQQRRRNLLARYPDVSEVHGEYVAPSAAADATDLMVKYDEDNSYLDIRAYARLTDDCSGLADEKELPTHVIAGRMGVAQALHALRVEAPEAYAKLLAIVAKGDDGDVPF